MNNEPDRNKFLFCAKATFIIFFLGGLSQYIQLWFLDEQGLSIISRTTPYWDFNNLWSGTRMALEGNIDTLFNPDQYRAELRARINPNIPDHEWSYPPSMLLFGTPFAIFPELVGYILWTISTLALLFLAVRTLKLPLPVTIAICLSPAILVSIGLGQNGALTSAFLIAGLSLTRRKPVMAGICFGLLTIKPQFGIIIPFLLLMDRNWITIMTACITAALLIIFSSLFFGVESWFLFLSETQPLMRGIMEAEYPKPYQISAGTVFIFFRSVGFNLHFAYGGQLVSTVFCIIATLLLWRKSNQMPHNLRVAFTCILTYLATPYGYTYDLGPTALAVAVFYSMSKGGKSAISFYLLLCLAWIFPFINGMMTVSFYVNFTALISIILILSAVIHLRIELKTLQPKHDFCDPS